MKLLHLMLLGVVSATSIQFPVHTNIFIVVDTYRTDEPSSVLELVTDLFSGISLIKYRISLRSTNGVSQKITDFESRQCLLQKMKEKKSKRAYQAIEKVLNNVTKEILNHFYMDDNILLIITDIPISSGAKDIISWTKTRAKVTHHIIRVQLSSKSKTKFKNQHAESRNTSELLKQLPFYQESLSSCSSTKTKPVYDECMRECSCINGTLTNCYRVRTHFSSLPLKQRLYFIEAYKTLGNNDRYRKAFYDILFLHPMLRFHLTTLTQQLEGFFPFHRRYVFIAENLFRLIDCRLTIPFWNFLLNYNHLFSKTPSYHVWDEYGGFGSTRTTIENGYCVETGDFSYRKWTVPEHPTFKMDKNYVIDTICLQKWRELKIQYHKCLEMLNKTLNPHCLSRTLSESSSYPLRSLQFVYNFIKNSSANEYMNISFIMQHLAHNPVHYHLGGLFGTSWASFDPVFLMFHSMIDGVWDTWQLKGPEYRKALSNDTSYIMVLINVPRYLYLDNDNLGGCGVKIKYKDIFPKNSVNDD